MPESHIERETNLSFGSAAILPDGGGVERRVEREGPESGLSCMCRHSASYFITSPSLRLAPLLLCTCNSRLSNFLSSTLSSQGIVI